MNLQYAVNNYDIKTNSIHSVILANETGTGTGGGTGDTNSKICYFKGKTNYSDYYICEADHPKTGPCGNPKRDKNYFFSVDNSTCSLE